MCWYLISWVPLYIWDISPISNVGCYFVLLMVSFALKKLLSFTSSHLLIVDLSAWAIGVLFLKLFLCQRIQGNSPFSLLNRFIYPILCWGFWSIWTWIFVQNDRNEFICILLHTDIQLDQHHLLKMLSLFHCIVLVYLSKIKCL